jgi:putative transposase
VALFLDAIYLPVRPMGRKEGVLCAWGIDKGGKRVLIDVCLGMRESEEDWIALGRGLVGRGLRRPLLVVSDGAPGLTNAIEALWPQADRQRCTVHYAEVRVMPTRDWKSPQLAGLAGLGSA